MWCSSGGDNFSFHAVELLSMLWLSFFITHTHINYYFTLLSANYKLFNELSCTDSPSDQDGGISIILNGEESELKFEIDGRGNKVI
jgi:hypothetical protein